MVACVALDGDMLLGKPCPCASGQSPALTCFWVAEPGSGLFYTTWFYTRMGMWRGPAVREG